MKNFAKFLLFVLLISAGISLLYDYRLRAWKVEFTFGPNAGEILAGFNA